MDSLFAKELYEIKRQTFLNGFIQNPDHFSEALAFSYYHRISPIFHEGDDGVSLYEDVYEVSTCFASRIIKYIDDNFFGQSDKKMTFSHLEGEFGKENRWNIYLVLTYAKLDVRFNYKLWDDISSDSPFGIDGIPSKFLPEECNF
ncbi:hypothetical protein [Saccharibacter floricola]|uniref:Uncharacterized protein n=1 Tax=Saccharibacter floricola DSM 15669 TaxID=1123227 RepID=A0ABQ0NZK5_9PROT|nr:hypothetical protein [Saccharibacter floricola]GBQ07308.1 hypothetical protein AA15669_1327 [Saccharibacter floricola DSM 15669]